MQHLTLDHEAQKHVMYEADMLLYCAYALVEAEKAIDDAQAATVRFFLPVRFCLTVSL